MSPSNARASGRPRRWISWLGNLVLLGLSVAVALGVGEVATRLLRPQQPRQFGQLYRPDSTLGFVRLAEVTRRINTGEGWVTLRTDRDGYRVAKTGRVEADTRVLVLGDSFMEARAVEFEASIPGLLQAALSRDLGRPVAVRNNGISGYGVDHYRLSGARALARESFAAVLVAVYVGNDITDRERASFPPLSFSTRPRARLPKRWTVKDFNMSVVRPLMLRLVAVSQLASLVWSETEAIRPRFGLSEWDFPNEILRSHAAGPQWDVTARICARIAAMADSSHAHTLFVLLPQYAQMDPGAIAGYARSFGIDPRDVDVDQPNRLLLASMRAQGLDVIDALDSLRGAHRRGLRVFGRIDHHLSAEGHRVVAALAEPALLHTLRERTLPATPGAPGITAVH